MKILYLAAGHGQINSKHDVVYQDLIVKRDIGGDMLDVDLNGYDLIIATPPCNYYSHANWRYKTSDYSNKTKHLLPEIISKLESIDVPVIIENVINKKRMSSILEKLLCFIPNVVDIVILLIVWLTFPLFRNHLTLNTEVNLFKIVL